MLIGIISDTHDHLDCIASAVKVFKSRKVEAVLHAGDYVSAESILPFQKLKVPFYGVLGNHEVDEFRIQEIGCGDISSGSKTIVLGGKKILLVHNLKSISMKQAAGAYDLIVYGDTHFSFCDGASLSNSILYQSLHIRFRKRFW